MRTILFALATVAAGAAFNAGAAQAENYPFCYKTAAGPGDCKYVSYAQCMAVASGVGGDCQPNSWLPPANGAPYSRRSARTHATTPQS